MSRRHQVKKTDTNEKEIVKNLRLIPGVSVETGHDDLLIGYRGRTYWFEIKNPNEIGKNGEPYKRNNETYKKQKKLYDEYRGHYSIVSTIDQILNEIGVLT